MLRDVTPRALEIVGTAVFRMVVSSDSMKKATATSQGRTCFTVEKLGARAASMSGKKLFSRQSGAAYSGDCFVARHHVMIPCRPIFINRPYGRGRSVLKTWLASLGSAPQE
jgi:hypothetical protein